MVIRGGEMIVGWTSLFRKMRTRPHASVGSGKFLESGHSFGIDPEPAAVCPP